MGLGGFGGTVELRVLQGSISNPGRGCALRVRSPSGGQCGCGSKPSIHCRRWELCSESLWLLFRHTRLISDLTPASADFGPAGARHGFQRLNTTFHATHSRNKHLGASGMVPTERLGERACQQGTGQARSSEGRQEELSCMACTRD